MTTDTEANAPRSLQYLIWIGFWFHPWLSRDWLNQYLTRDFLFICVVWILPVMCTGFYHCINSAPLKQYFDKYSLRDKSFSIQEIDLHNIVTRHFWKSRIFITLIYLVMGLGTGGDNEKDKELYDASLPATPSRLQSIIEIVISLLITDFYYYWYHRAFHHPWLYRYHKYHHQFVKSIDLAVNWMSFIETVTGTSVMLFAPIWIMKMSPITTFMWIIVTVTRGYYDHAGYDLPIEPFQLIPFGNNVKAHDDHHKYGSSIGGGNYGAFFSWCDTVFGTSISK
ncbi:MAG: hypothetical protein Solumvirus2_18 [Solumvirus sp.]|uniref:Fatty acid hydroxylase domain-containing protein n=1 Tax=Solumvirus sp. TaxID=2487773 RepID=A0A3G5AIT4_9VIRU|nr:MAG: hypothetical protein Solumvirus2_18 [Solumvirus sp.]